MRADVLRYDAKLNVVAAYENVIRNMVAAGSFCVSCGVAKTKEAAQHRRRQVSSSESARLPYTAPLYTVHRAAGLHCTIFVL